jgi:hypothetical protein
LAPRDFGALRFALPVALAIFGVVLRVGRFVDLVVALRLEVAAERLLAAERFAFRRLLAPPLEAVFFVLAPRLVVLDFFCSPVSAPTNELTALFATSTAAFTFALAASPIAS